MMSVLWRDSVIRLMEWCCVAAMMGGKSMQRPTTLHQARTGSCNLRWNLIILQNKIELAFDILLYALMENADW